MDLQRMADEAIQQYETYAQEYARLCARELLLHDEKSGVRQEAIRRLKKEQNPVTGNPHSATSAAAVVELDPAYADLLRQIRETVAKKYEAEGNLVAARLRAELAIATLRATERVAA